MERRDVPMAKRTKFFYYLVFPEIIKDKQRSCQYKITHIFCFAHGMELANNWFICTGIKSKTLKEIKSKTLSSGLKTEEIGK
jgi:hypothetical protein